MVMISLRSNELLDLAWIMTHTDVLRSVNGMEHVFLGILRKFKKGVKKPFYRKVVQGKIDKLINFYPNLAPKKRVK